MSELPIHLGTPLRTAPLPSRPHIGAEERRALLEVVDNGRRSATQGTKVREFERRWGDLHDSDRAVAVPNGSPAIDVGLLALNVVAGVEKVQRHEDELARSTS